MAAISGMTIDELVEEFEQLEDWEDQCNLLLDLGAELPRLPAELHVEANRVHGCQSNVWLTADLDRSESPPVMEFRASSDSRFVSGLVAVVLMLFNGKTPAEVLETDPAPVFRRLGLHVHLSSQRRNGLAGMVKRIHALAQQQLGVES